MDRTAMIDEILRMVPGTPDGQARSRPLLEAMPDAELARAHHGMATLHRDGREFLERADPSGELRRALADNNRAALEQIRQARARLDEIETRIRARHANTGTGTQPAV